MPDLEDRVFGRDERALLVDDRQRARPRGQSRRDLERADAIGTPEQLLAGDGDRARGRCHGDRLPVRQRDARADAGAAAKDTA
jgi:hypothetical protein